MEVLKRPTSLYVATWVVEEVFSDPDQVEDVLFGHIEALVRTARRDGFRANGIMHAKPLDTPDGWTELPEGAPDGTQLLLSAALVFPLH